MVAKQAVEKTVAKRTSLQKPVPADKRQVNDLDSLIHERTRLAIVSALAVSPVLGFTDLKAMLKVSDGNLSAHARKLEEGGYLACSKRFEGRVPKTEYQLTAKGKKALQGYIQHMEAVIDAMKQG